jgi:catecholate siderophore receptor
MNLDNMSPENYRSRTGCIYRDLTMSFIHSKKHNQPYPAALASALLLAMPAAYAQDAGKLAEVEVKGSTISTELIAEKASSAKQVKPLVDTPQTIVVLKKELFQQQQANSLSDILRNTPGITMLMGENGNTATGDSIFMRGFDTQNSIYIDGIRDLGSVSRDAFNTDQIEIAKGPAGVDNGRGSSSGYINMGSKMAQLDSFITGNAAVGSGSHKRVSADINQTLAIDNAAVRINLLRQDTGVPGRDEAGGTMTGLASSLAFGLNTATRATLNLLHVQQDNTPDGGIPTIGLDGFYSAAIATAFPNNTAPVLSKVDRENFYGSKNDFDHVVADMLTLRVEHDFADNIKLQNTSRYGVSSQDYILTGVNAGAAGIIVPASTKQNLDSWQVNRNRQGKDQQNQILINQTNLSLKLAQGALVHNIASGVEFSYESQQNYTLALPAGVTQLNANLYQPSTADSFAMPVRTGAKTDGSTSTAALYLLDTVDLNAQWQVSAGVRAEHYDTDTNIITVQGTATPQTIPVGTLIGSQANKSDNLLSYKVGANYKPTENGSVYLSYATSQLPPGGTNFSLSTAANNQNNPMMDPQKGTNLELGTKWQLLDKNLFATAAVFESVNKNELVQDDLNTYLPLGEKTVRGVEFGLVGSLFENFELNAGLALLDPEITRGARIGTAPTEGAVVQWTPKTTFTLWGTYRWADWHAGAGLRYTDSVRRSNRTDLLATNNSMLEVPDYWVVDAAIAYQVTPAVAVQFNLYNLLDEEYVQSLNNGGGRYHQGAPRSAKLGVNVAF